MKSRITRRVINILLNGVILTVPTAVTVYIIYQVLRWFGSILPRLFFSSERFEEFEKSGPAFWILGILSLVVALFVIGWLGELFINDRLKIWFERQVDRIPGIKNVYKTLSDVLGAFVGSKKRFNKPVLVKVSEQLDLEMIGFVTDEDLKELGQIDGKVAVYFPMSFSISGHLMVVPSKNVKHIDRNPVDVMKYAVSGGVAEIDVDEKKDVSHG